MTSHNIACQKCLKKSDFYIEEDNILADVKTNQHIWLLKSSRRNFKVLTICPHCDEIYVLDGTF